jgi:hypothetical protein
MATDFEIEYLGWSCFRLGSSQGDLFFDPIYRPYSGVTYTSPEAFDNAKIICVTHGHQEHYFDVPAIVKRTGATVVAGKDICNHLHWIHRVPREHLRPVEPLQPVEVEGFKITTFHWRHRDVNPIRGVLRPQIIEGMKWAWQALVLCPAWAKFTGFHVELEDGRKVLNYNEGFNSAMRIEEVQALGERFETDVLLAGMQLNFEEYAASGGATFSPKTVLLFHPHKEFFDQLGKVSSSPETFAEAVKRELPDADVIPILPGWASG